MQERITPLSTPLSLKILLGATLLASLFSYYLAPFLILTPSHPFWQLLTYPLIHPFPSGLLHLAFNLYLIWTFGASLIQRLHAPRFFALYFGSSLLGALFAFAAMTLFSSPIPLFGSSTPIYALLISWTLLNPGARLLLFFSFPLKAANLLLILLSLSLLVDLSSAQWPPFFAAVGAILFSYLFTLLACRARSSFSFLSPLETTLLRTLEKMEHWKRKGPVQKKIYDIRSGEPVLNDEEFMDAMLARISLKGEGSLSPEERQRMQKISEKKSSTH